MKILAVCMGNICRSPMAEAIIRHSFEKEKIDVFVDSAGTIGFHTGENPDHRAQLEMRKHEIDISKLRARKFSIDDFDTFDLILPMDTENMREIINLARNTSDRNKVKLIMNFAYPNKNISVPDPYYGNDDDFHSVYLMIKEAAESLVKQHQSIDI